jgi:hypothetical protein
VRRRAVTVTATITGPNTLLNPVAQVGITVATNTGSQTPS